MYKFTVVLSFSFLILSCSPINWLGDDEAALILEQLNGNWNMTQNTFDWESPVNAEDYDILIFDNSGADKVVHIADSVPTVFETNRIDKFTGDSTASSGAFLATITVQTVSSDFVGGENYWTYSISSGTMTIRVYDDKTMSTRFVEFICSR